MCEHEWVTIFYPRELNDLDPNTLAWAWSTDITTAGPWRACTKCHRIEDE